MALGRSSVLSSAGAITVLCRSIPATTAHSGTPTSTIRSPAASTGIRVWARLNSTLVNAASSRNCDHPRPSEGAADGVTIDFVVVPDRAQLSEVVQRARNGRLRTNIGNVAALDDAVAAFNPTERVKGKTIIRVRP